MRKDHALPRARITPCHAQGSCLCARNPVFFPLCDSVRITTVRETADNPPSRSLEIPQRPGERNAVQWNVLSSTNVPFIGDRHFHGDTRADSGGKSCGTKRNGLGPRSQNEKERASSAFSERKGTCFIGVSEQKGTAFVRVSDLVPSHRAVVEPADQACAHGIHNNPTYPVAVVLAGACSSDYLIDKRLAT
jgi:hypothetical protein